MPHPGFGHYRDSFLVLVRDWVPFDDVDLNRSMLLTGVPITVAGTLSSKLRIVALFVDSICHVLCRISC